MEALSVVINIKYPILYDNQVVIEKAIQTVETIKENRDIFLKNEKNIQEHEKLFIYSYSLFESFLFDSLKFFLNCFPDKNDKKNFPFEKEIITKEILTEFALDYINTNYIRTISSKPLVEFINEYINLFEIESTGINIDIFKKMSVARNILVHDYFSKENSIEKNIYLFYIETIIDTVYLLIDKIEKKYKKYNYFYLVKQLWNYTFQTPLLKYENIVREHKQSHSITFNVEEIKRVRKCLSSSEKYFLVFWIMQYSNTIVEKYFKFNDCCRSIATFTDKEKLIFLFNVFCKYPNLIN